MEAFQWLLVVAWSEVRTLGAITAIATWATLTAIAITGALVARLAVVALTRVLIGLQAGLGLVCHRRGMVCRGICPVSRCTGLHGFTLATIAVWPAFATALTAIFTATVPTTFNTRFTRLWPSIALRCAVGARFTAFTATSFAIASTALGTLAAFCVAGATIRTWFAWRVLSG